MKISQRSFTLAASLGITCSLATLPLAQGAAVIYEGFDYDVTNPGDPPPNNVVQGEGPSAAGTTGTWSGDSRLDVASGSLSYGSLETSGNSAQWIGTGGGGGNLGINITSDLSNASLLNHGATLWFSIVMGLVDNGNDEMAFTLGTAEGFTNNLQGGEGFGIYTNGTGNTQAALYTGGTLQSATGTSNFQGTTQLIVGQIVWGADGSTADSLTLYSPGTDLDITGHSFSTSSAIINQSSLSRIGIWARNNDTDSYDEIRFGATLADVTPVPEPSAALLGGLGILALLRRRR